MQSYGSSELDASLLLIPLVGLPAAGRSARRRNGRRDRARPRCATASCCATTASATSTACHRAKAYFLACSFWLADNLMPCWAGTTKRARCSSGCSRCATTSACSPRNTTSAARRMLGNFPQAFSHVGLVNTAFNLTRRASPIRQRSEGEAPPPAPLTPPLSPGRPGASVRRASRRPARASRRRAGRHGPARRAGARPGRS